MTSSYLFEAFPLPFLFVCFTHIQPEQENTFSFQVNLCSFELCIGILKFLFHFLYKFLPYKFLYNILTECLDILTMFKLKQHSLFWPLERMGENLYCQLHVPVSVLICAVLLPVPQGVCKGRRRSFWIHGTSTQQARTPCQPHHSSRLFLLCMNCLKALCLPLQGKEFLNL